MYNLSWFSGRMLVEGYTATTRVGGPNAASGWVNEASTASMPGG